MRLTTTLLDPTRVVPLQTLPAGLHQQLPADYVELVAAYGTGTYCGEVVVAYPDSAAIPLTFGEIAADLWELNEHFTAVDLQAATQLGWSANEDILCVTSSRPGQVFVLPRHAEVISSWPTFWSAIHSLVPPLEEAYFDPDFETVIVQMSLAQHNQLVPIEPIWQAFQQHFTADFIVRAARQQPVYILSQVGGWVSFDLVYKSSITVKYQRLLAERAAVVLDWLRQHIY